MPSIVGNNFSSKEERIAYHIDHALSLFQNITKNVAMKALRAILEEGGCSQLKKEEHSFVDWQIYGQVRVLKGQLERNKKRTDEMGKYIATTLQEAVIKQLERISAEETSYDNMTNAMLERFQFHPYKAKILFQKAISLNSRNFEAIYCQSMISLRLIRVIDYLKCMRVALNICEQEIHEMRLACRTNQDVDLIWFDDTPIKQTLAFRHAITGRIYIKYKQHKRALREYKMALNYDPKFMFSYFYMGQYYAFDGERNEALAKKNFERALALVGVQRRTVYTSLIYDNMGQSCENFTDNQAAMECYEKAVQNNEQYGWGFQGRCYVNTSWNMYDKAIRDSSMCLEFKPEMREVKAEILAERGRIQFGLDNKEQCFRDLETSRSLDKTRVYPYLMLSFLEKDKKRALEILDEGEKNCASDPADLQAIMDRKAWYYTYVNANAPKAALYSKRVVALKKSIMRID